MSHHHHHNASKNLKVAFFLNLGFTLLEIVGGLYVNSVAIISDAIHDLGDSLSLGTAWYLNHASKKKADQHFSFGYARFSLLGALLNSLVLIVGSVFVIYEAVQRILVPEPSDANGMLAFAILGIAVNGYAAWKMKEGNSLNEKVVAWHLMEDVLGWVAVLIVAIILQFTENLYLDPALSLLITTYILWGVAKRLKETLYLFLQGIPKDISVATIQKECLAIGQVKEMNNTHVWSLDGEQHVFSTHLTLQYISDFKEYEAVKKELNSTLQKYGFAHVSLDIELDEKTCTSKALNTVEEALPKKH